MKFPWHDINMEPAYEFDNYTDGRTERPSGEICYIQDGRFHRVEGPARYMPDGRRLFYFNGNDVTREVEDMYGDEQIAWVDEANYKDDTKDMLTPESCFTVELAFSGKPFGKTARNIMINEQYAEKIDNAIGIYNSYPTSGKTNIAMMVTADKIQKGETIGFINMECSVDDYL